MIKFTPEQLGDRLEFLQEEIDEMQHLLDQGEQLKIKGASAALQHEKKGLNVLVPDLDQETERLRLVNAISEWNRKEASLREWQGQLLRWKERTVEQMHDAYVQRDLKESEYEDED